MHYHARNKGSDGKCKTSESCEGHAEIEKRNRTASSKLVTAGRFLMILEAEPSKFRALVDQVLSTESLSGTSEERPDAVLLIAMEPGSSDVQTTEGTNSKKNAIRLRAKKSAKASLKSLCQWACPIRRRIVPLGTRHGGWRYVIHEADSRGPGSVEVCHFK